MFAVLIEVDVASVDREPGLIALREPVAEPGLRDPGHGARGVQRSVQGYVGLHVMYQSLTGEFSAPTDRALTSPSSMRNQLRPIFDRIVIKELDPDRIRRSGLLVPPGSDEPPPQHGIVLAVGPGLDWWDHVGVAMPVKPGDHVVFPAAAGTWVEVDEERLLVCRVGELLGVLEQVEDCPACGGKPLAAHESCPVCGREGSVSSR